MRATDRGRWLVGLGLSLAGCSWFGAGEAHAQFSGLFGGQKAKPAPAAAAAKKGDEEQVIKIVPKAVPVSPSDAVAIVNGEAITRQQLADEAVARKGKEVLETMVAGKIIDQAVNAKKIVISSEEVENEITAIANSMGVSKENWLRTLDKERGVSPLQYKRDIIYRIVALRKLAEPRVVVTEDDLRKAFEANFGEKLHYRIIMTRKMEDAKAIWNELKQNPTAFEKIARDDPRSIDQETKPIGGLAIQPMARYALPLHLSEKAFEQLVDGDPTDKDPAHKPKDGDISGPIEMAVVNRPTDSTYVILKRESLDPAQPYDPNDKEKKEQYRAMIFDVKLKDEMQTVYTHLAEAAAVENRLTGEVRLAREKDQPESRTDGDVKLMNGTTAPSKSQGTPGGGTLNLPKPQNAPPKPEFGKGATPEK